jgi:hypothetical protein
MLVTTYSDSPLLAIDSVLLSNLLHSLRFGYRTSLLHSWNTGPEQPLGPFR